MITSKDLSPKEAAAILGCHVKFVLSEIRARRLRPVVRVNKRVIRVPTDTVDKYKRERTT